MPGPRRRDIPDFSRSGNETASGGRLVWLLLVLALLAGLVLFSAFRHGPEMLQSPAGASAPGG